MDHPVRNHAISTNLTIALNSVPDEEVDRGRVGGVEAPLEELLGDVAGLQEAAGHGRGRLADGLRHLLPRGVGEGHVQRPPLPAVLRGRLLRPPDQRPQVLGQHPPVPDDLDPHAVTLQLVGLVNQPPELVPGEVEQALHLRLRPLEVLDAERVDGDLLDAELVAPLCRVVNVVMD